MADLPLEEVTRKLVQEHDFSDASIALLMDKGFSNPKYLTQYNRLYEAMNLPDETFAEWRDKKSWIDIMLERGDSEEITTGRYNKFLDFKDISTEQALVQGRMEFGIEYVIELADEVAGVEDTAKFIERPFTDEEKVKLRSIYQNFRTKDFIAASLIERPTNHDIVAANTWVTILAQKLGIDEELMRRILHYARTSSDANTNVTGRLYTRAIGKWTSSLNNLVKELATRGTKYAEMSCIAETHGQSAQLTTVGYIYSNLAEQIWQHAQPLLQAEKLTLDGKIAGAIGTDVDMVAAFPTQDFTKMYSDIVEDHFGLNYVDLGNDQDCSNAAFCRALDTMVNVGNIIKKAATDTWLYASRGILAKKMGEGESGSSAMPQKVNPFFAEGAEALIEIMSSMATPIKKLLTAYREQGDLRRSITKREAFHPMMLSIIAIERLTGEIKRYEPNVVEIESEVYKQGPKVIASALNNYLRAKGMPDAYDRIKELTQKPQVTPEEVTKYISGMRQEGVIDAETAVHVGRMLQSVMDIDGYMPELYKTEGAKQQKVMDALAEMNKHSDRLALTGHAVQKSLQMAAHAEETIELLARYAA